MAVTVVDSVDTIGIGYMLLRVSDEILQTYFSEIS
jgi:hypothetical protein